MGRQARGREAGTAWEMMGDMGVLTGSGIWGPRKVWNDIIHPKRVFNGKLWVFGVITR